MYVTFQLCLWCIFTVLLVLPYITTNPLSGRWQTIHNTAAEKEYWFELQWDKRIILEISPKQIKIVCNGFEEPDAEYIDHLKNSGLFDFEEAQDFEKLFLKQCPTPDVSFRDLLNIFNVTSVKIIIFESYLNISDHLKANHFENLTEVETIELTNNKITELPESLFKGVPNLKKLNLNGNAVGALPKRLFEPTPKLRRLELGYNKLTTLDGDLFRYVPELTYLNAYKNKLKKLTETAFDHLVNLTSLDLSDNKIESIDETAFVKLSNLTVLNLGFNNLTRLPEKLFANNGKLNRVTLMSAFNRNESTLPAGLFSDLRSLETVMLHMNNFTTLPENLFKNCVNLSMLTLYSNSLTSLPSNIFKDTKALETLDLRSNKLEFLDGRLLKQLKNLVKLQLGKNNLKTIHGDAFSTLTNLKELDLSRNNLVDFEMNTFSGLASLSKLSIMHNRLTLNRSLETYYNNRELVPDKRSPFGNLLNLEILELTNNSLTTMFDDWLITMTKLKVLDLSFNKFEIINGEDLFFATASNNPTVKLNNNKIHTFYLKRLEYMMRVQCLPGQCNELQRGETYIDIENNPIKCDCGAHSLASYFQKKMLPLVNKHVIILNASQVLCHSPETLRNVSLENIDLKDLVCELSSVDRYLPDHHLNNDVKNETKNCPAGCKCLYRPEDRHIVVNCSNTRMKSLPLHLPNVSGTGVELLLDNNELTSLNGLQQLFSMVNITKLSLSHNHLKNFDDIKIPATLKTLELDHNNISYLSNRLIEQLESSHALTEIALYKNPWRCDCDTQRLMNFLGSQIKRRTFSNHLEIICRDSGRSIYHLTSDDLCGISQNFILACVSLAAFGIICGVVVALLTIYEHEIKVWLFAHKLFLWWVTEKELDKDKIYDAFISYSHKDEAFVVNELMRELEKTGTHRYKLCVHFRDFVAGEYIPNQIVNSVDKSRRTVIVLSPNFLNSVWAQMEFRTAHLKTLKEKRIRVIVILLEDVKMDALDPELKAYITMNTYLKWGDSNFWEKLKFALPHPQDVYVKKRKANVAPWNESELKKQLEILRLQGVITEKF